MTVLHLLVVLAAATILVYLFLFIAGVRRKKQVWTSLVGGYLKHLFGGAGMALALAIVVVFGKTAYYNSPQGPLALIFVGPVALFVGGLLGISRWLLKEPPPQPH